MDADENERAVGSGAPRGRAASSMIAAVPVLVQKAPELNGTATTVSATNAPATKGRAIAAQRPYSASGTSANHSTANSPLTCWVVPVEESATTAGGSARRSMARNRGPGVNSPDE